MEMNRITSLGYETFAAPLPRVPWLLSCGSVVCLNTTVVTWVSDGILSLLYRPLRKMRAMREALKPNAERMKATLLSFRIDLRRSLAEKDKFLSS